MQCRVVIAFWCQWTVSVELSAVQPHSRNSAGHLSSTLAQSNLTHSRHSIAQVHRISFGNQRSTLPSPAPPRVRVMADWALSSLRLTWL